MTDKEIPAWKLRLWATTHTTPHKKCLSCNKVPIHPATYCPFCGRKYSIINLTHKEYDTEYKPLAYRTTNELEAAKKRRILWSNKWDAKTNRPLKERAWTLSCMYSSCKNIMERKIKPKHIRCEECHALWEADEGKEWYTLIKEGNKP